MNAAPQHHYVMQAALRALDRWVRTGEAPPIAERLQVSDSGALVLDAHGNARGGVRSPWVDVPTAQLSGLGQDGPGLLRLFGSTQPFRSEEHTSELQSLMRISYAVFCLKKKKTLTQVSCTHHVQIS